MKTSVVGFLFCFLMLSCEQDHMATTQQIIDIQTQTAMEANTCTGGYGANFITAVSTGDLSTVNNLLVQPMCSIAQDSKSRSVLLIAITDNSSSNSTYIPVMNSLIAKGAGGTINTYHDGADVLLVALVRRLPDVVKLLVNGGADVNSVVQTSTQTVFQPLKGYSALMLAILANDLDSAKILLSYGAKINVTATDGSTAFSLAQNNSDMTDLLQSYNEVSYTKDMLPIIQSRCIQCHNQTWPWADWTNYNTTYSNRNDIYSRAVQQVSEYGEPNQGMPPKNNVTGMTDDERKTVAVWVKSGAVYGGVLPILPAIVPQGPVMPSTEPTPVPAAITTVYRYSKDIKTLFELRCGTCHNATWPAKNWGDFSKVIQNLSVIYTRVDIQKTMPLNNQTNMTDAERTEVGAWIQGGAPL